MRFLCLYVKAQPVCVVELQKSSNLYKDLNFRGLFGTFIESLSSIHFLSENAPWTYCKREQTEIENSTFLPRWHLEGKFGIRSGIVLWSTLCLWKERGNWNLSSYYLLWNKNTGNQKDFASCECKSHSRMQFTGGPWSPRCHYPSRCETKQECKA